MVGWLVRGSQSQVAKTRSREGMMTEVKTLPIKATLVEDITRSKNMPGAFGLDAVQALFDASRNLFFLRTTSTTAWIGAARGCPAIKNSRRGRGVVTSSLI
jgi:hypothetical protein